MKSEELRKAEADLRFERKLKWDAIERVETVEAQVVKLKKELEEERDARFQEALQLESERDVALDKLSRLEESYVRTINRDGEYANVLLAEVARLEWMLDAHLSDPVSYDKQAIMADLEARWEEHCG